MTTRRNFLFGAGAFLSGCSNSLNQVNKPAAGAAGGALLGAALTRGSSASDQRLASGAGALIGYVIGAAATSPCRTTQSGVVIETNGQRSQSQQTAYYCTSSGAPAGANPPVFNFIATGTTPPQDAMVQLTRGQITQFIEGSDSDAIAKIANQSGVTVPQLQEAAIDMATSGASLAFVLDSMNEHGITLPAQQEDNAPQLVP